MKGVKFKYRRKPIKEAEDEPVSGEQSTEQTTDAAEKSADQTKSSDSAAQKDEKVPDSVYQAIQQRRDDRVKFVQKMNTEMSELDKQINLLIGNGDPANISKDAATEIDTKILAKLMRKRTLMNDLFAKDIEYITFLSKYGIVSDLKD